jgi:signal transduction histidine kinase
VSKVILKGISTRVTLGRERDLSLQPKTPIIELARRQRCYNLPVEKSPLSTVKASSADLGFALVVLVSYLAALSAWQSASMLELAAIICAGIGYISMGIYGYAYAARGQALWMRVVYFIVQIPLGGVIVFLGKGSGFNAMVLLPLAAQSVILMQGALFYAANLAILLTFVFSVFFFNLGWANFWSGIQIFLAGQAFVIIFTHMAVKEERSRKVIERLASDLAEANQSLRQYALQVEELTLNKERNRLAREIHDGLGHYLTTIHMHLQAASVLAQQRPGNPQITPAISTGQAIAEVINTAQELTQEALEDVRLSVAALRAPLDEGLPLPQRIAALLESIEISGLQTAFTLLGLPRSLSSEADWTLYRAAQEGLHNTSKHARAAHFWLTLDYSQPQQVRLLMEDDGVGVQHIESGFGLLGLQERVNLMNGSTAITSNQGEGFKIEVFLPE